MTPEENATNLMAMAAQWPIPPAGSTMREVCEYVAAWLNAKHSPALGYPPISGERVFTISPRGELWPVFALYAQARDDEATGVWVR